MAANVFRYLKTQLIVLWVTALFITGCVNISTRERFEGAWIIPGENNLLTFSSSSSTKGFYQTYYIRRIDPESGKITNFNSINLKYQYSVQLKYCTQTSIWLQSENEFICFDYPSLKKRWNNAKFYEQIKNKHPEIGDPYSCKLITGKFEITNKTGKTFLIGTEEFESEGSHVILFFNESNQLGKTIYYPTPETRFIQNAEVKIEVENVDEKKEYNWAKMNIREKLLADTGYARNYAVFTPDSNCYFFDGNHSRTVKKLANDSLELIWKPAFDNREWLEGDFLRPYKGYRDLPQNRLITVQNNIAFIHYQTSLDKKENKLKLAGVDLKTEKVLWEIDLSSSQITDGNKPQHSGIIQNTLVVIWVKMDKEAILTGIDVATGTVKWKLRK